MDTSSYDLPIEWQPTFDILDSSKIQSFQDCPRGFFFAHILGWQDNYPSIHLAFGSAWHEAMEILAIAANEGPYTDEIVGRAYLAFLKVLNEKLPPGFNEYGAKSPENALSALDEYCTRFAKDHIEYDTIYTEIAGTVPISDSRVLHYKLDTLLKNKRLGLYLSREHKTTGRLSSAWSEKWDYLFQIACYSHVLNAMHPGEVWGIEINGAILRAPTKAGKGNDFVRLPVQKSRDQLSAFIWDANHWVDLIEWNMKQLEKSDRDARVMPAFPINSASCSKFGCRLKGLCAHRPNPLRNCENVPAGMKKEFWDPRRQVAEAKVVIDLTQESLTDVNRGILTDG